MINQPEPERMTAVTHDGTFHADDAFATAILRIAVDGIEIKRTRHADTIAEADIAYDVGGVFDPVNLRFDHHMAEPPKRRDGTPYSSAGLLWERYGHQALCKRGFEDAPIIERQAAWERIDALFQHIDKVDNGVTPTTATDIASLIDTMNPVWNDEDVNAEGNAFRRAADFAEAHLEGLIAREAAKLEVEPNFASTAPTFDADDAFANAILSIATDGVDVKHAPGHPSTRLLWESHGYQVLRKRGFRTTPVIDMQDAWAAIDTLFQHIEKVGHGATPATPTDVTSVIDAMNPVWTDDDVNAEGNAFRRAAGFAEAHLEALIAREAGKLKAELIVMDAAWKSEDPRLLVLDQYAPFKRIVFERDIRELLYVVAPGGTRDRWTVTAIPVAADSYVNRRDLPAHWAGLSDAELQAATGVEDAVFAHRNLFIAIAKSKAGAMRLAQIALGD